MQHYMNPRTHHELVDAMPEFVEDNADVTVIVERVEHSNTSTK